MEASKSGCPASDIEDERLSCCLLANVEKLRLPEGFAFAAPEPSLIESCMTLGALSRAFFSSSRICLSCQSRIRRAQLQANRTSCTGVPWPRSGPSPPVIAAIFAASSLTCSCCCMLGPTAGSPSALGSLPGLLVLLLSAKKRHAAGLWKFARKAAVGLWRMGRVRKAENGFIGGIVDVLGWRRPCVVVCTYARGGDWK